MPEPPSPGPLPRSALLDLPQLELECMRVLWRQAPATVRDVRDAIAREGRPLAYTTVQTLLDRLTRKQAAARVKRGRAFVYSARIGREEMRERALARLYYNFYLPDEPRPRLESGRNTASVLPQSGPFDPSLL